MYYFRLEVIRSTEAASEPMLGLFSNIFPIIERADKTQKVCFQIAGAYILLCPQEFMAAYADTLVACCTHVCPELDPTTSQNLATMLETLFICFPTDGPNLFGDCLVALFGTMIELQVC